MKQIFTSLLLALSLISFAQDEMESALTTNPEIVIRSQKERSFTPRALERGGSLSLPFFDDFSRYSLPTSDPEIPTSWRRWEDDHVHLNSDFPIEPPSIGVATFDGLDNTGYPYDFYSANAYGPADTLTSRPIDLSGMTETDNVYLTFFYQAEGRGYEVSVNDSLVLEFFTPLGGGVWEHIWATPGIPLGDFQQVFIPITASKYLLDGFQFRFRNYAELSGNLDHWHLDYVFLDEQIDPDDFPIDDLTYMYRNHSLLNELTAMPWLHFKSDPGSFMLDEVYSDQRNLGPAQNFISGYIVEYEDQSWERTTPPNTGGNGFSLISTLHAVNGGDDPFVYDTEVNDTCAIFNVKFYHEQSDFITQNDTASFEQNFTNYYAYDDGSAERAYSVNVAGGRIAMGYETAMTDTLLGLLIHFNPTGPSSEGENFLLRIWEDNGGQPGDQIVEMFAFHDPVYYQDGYNVFTYYPYDEPVEVSGKFFVGWTQVSNAKLKVGNDKNTNANVDHLYYQLGEGASWQSSNIQGSVMIRPVFKAGKVSIPNDLTELNDPVINMYPNPVQDQLNIEWASHTGPAQISIFDMTGRKVDEFLKASPVQMDLSSYPNGIYMMQWIDPERQLTYTRKFVKH